MPPGREVMSALRDLEGIQPMADGRIVDICVHIVDSGGLATGCRVSPEVLASAAFDSMLMALNIPAHEVRCGRIGEVLLDIVNASSHIDGCILLAMDGIHKNSRLMEGETQLMVPNSYVSGMARENSRVFFGASVHPYRDKKELLYATDECLAEGAVLFNWAPSVQQIDPEDDRCIPLYIRLAREGVPLFCHLSGELAGPHHDRKAGIYCDPKRLIRALDIGVKVIVSGCAQQIQGESLSAGTLHFEEIVGMLRAAEERQWEFYLDSSFLGTPGGLSSFDRIMGEIAKGRINRRRLLYGSGFPFAVAARQALVSAKALPTGGRNRNPLDENFEFAADVAGVHDYIFTNAANVLKL